MHAGARPGGGHAPEAAARLRCACGEAADEADRSRRTRAGPVSRAAGEQSLFLPAPYIDVSALLWADASRSGHVVGLRRAPTVPPLRTRPATPRRTRQWRRSSGRWRCSASAASCTAAWTPRRPTWRRRNGAPQRLLAPRSQATQAAPDGRCVNGQHPQRTYMSGDAYSQIPCA